VGAPQSLRKGGRAGANNFLGALLAVPRSTRSMFVHAVQALPRSPDTPAQCLVAAFLVSTRSK